MTVNPMLPKHRLILLRHAKSAWPDGVADRERPLADRGRKAARVIGTYMVREKLIPDLALVSPARRAKETWKLVRGALSKKVSEREAADIYEVSAERILDVIRAVELASARCSSSATIPAWRMQPRLSWRTVMPMPWDACRRSSRRRDSASSTSILTDGARLRPAPVISNGS